MTSTPRLRVVQRATGNIGTLLAAGVDVVTTTGVGAHAASIDLPTRDRIEAACRHGRSSIHRGQCPAGPQTELEAA